MLHGDSECRLRSTQSAELRLQMRLTGFRGDRRRWHVTRWAGACWIYSLQTSKDHTRRLFVL